MGFEFIGVICCVAVMCYCAGYTMHQHGREAGYDEGWRDCERIHRYFEQPDNEEQA